jgi:hypothetical protein
MSADLEPSIRESTLLKAALNYTRKTGIRPVNYTFDPPPGIPRNSGEVDARSVTIHNASQTAGLKLDVSGFEMIKHQSSLTNWSSFQDSTLTKDIDYPEVISALKTHTGAEKVIIFDHTLRDSTVRPGNDNLLREAVRRVHNDQTLDSAPRRVAKHLTPGEAEWRLRRRFAIINFWRPVTGPVLQTPLALYDAGTIDPKDLMPSDLVYRDWTGETYGVAYNPCHRWYWYPRQLPTEATLIKIYDSATDAARLSAHTAFDDPSSASDAPARRSIEIRAIAFW